MYAIRLDDARFQITHSVGVLIEVAPLEHDHEHQPAKNTQQEQNLRDELQQNIYIILKMPARRKKNSAHKMVDIHTCKKTV